jgi:alpha-beta hydrolase superfamily lysophospholipase
VADYVAAASTDQRPAILAGISWGGKLAPAVAKRHPGLLAGMALICPGMFSRFGARPLQRWAARLAARTRARLRPVKIPLQESFLFTDEPAWQRWIDRDPLVLRRLTVRAAKANLDLGEYAEDAEAFSGKLLVLLAGRDRIIDNLLTRRFFERAASRSKKLVEYPRAAHTFEFEPAAHHRYPQDLIAWCHDVIGPQQPL